MTTSLTLSRQLLPYFLAIFFASLHTCLAKPAIASLYAQHCESIAPESSPTKLLFGASNSFLISDGFFSAGNSTNHYLFPSPSTDHPFIHDSPPPSIFHFKPGPVHLTHDDGTLQLKGSLVLVGALLPINQSGGIIWSSNNRRRVIFKLSGFWSEAKGKLCMVGTGEFQPPQHDPIASTLSAVLKLEFPKVSKIMTSIIKGSIESLDIETSPTHFESISLLAYAQRRYNYTVTEQAEESCSHLPHEETAASDSTSVCSNIQSIMQYESFTSSDLINFLGFRFLSTSQLVCSDDGKVHLSMTLSNKTTRRWYGIPILPGKSLVAEGVWDHHNNKLCLIACSLIGKANNLSVVEDCSLGITFWFPSYFSLKQRSSMVGRMWNMSNKSTDNDGYRIFSLYSTENYRSSWVPGLKYNYTELERARKYCEIKNTNPKKTGKYPDVQSYMDMRFDLSVHDGNGRSEWGNAQLISVGETYLGNQYGGGDSMYVTGDTTIPSNSSMVDQSNTTWDVGYTLSYSFWDGNNSDSVQISAEGIYNSTTGTLCLIGCRKPNFRHTTYGEILNSSARIDDRNLDCGYFIQLQFPPIDSKNVKGKGTIKSTRAKSDPLYFEQLEVTFSLMYRSYSIQEYDRMDAEMIMVIISLTLLCACTYLQLRHSRRHSTICPLMSITMLVVLTLGCMVSIILNTEAMIVRARKDHPFLRSGGWLETTNAIARLFNMIALLINIRILQLAWRSRSKEEATRALSRGAEKKSLIVCAPLYIVGALIVWFVHSRSSRTRRAILEDLARFVGLIVDSFLLPQIIFNVFSQSNEKVLSPFFYFGATLNRVVPHIYNIYRAWWYPENFYNPSYIYAGHANDYYSTLFDVIIPLEGMLFVFLIHLQQKFGGRCFLTKRFKYGADYELAYGSNI
ncbi:hypothetical protein LUZ63_004176 [Rhynchospora breviuscula]|uniref:RING-type E3 ubiquitin transferase n=1 Tax=Rhynchospora breviuscula TaxID=2022672 RepID=A0A9Q0HZR3_9POAL|nr:hypothetical protein LUZ63_004176 [Rhynchospora breviuscula]